MGHIEQQLLKLGYELPIAPTPIAKFVPAVKANGLIFVSGQGPVINDVLKYTGHVGSDLTLEQGQECARLCIINCLAAVKGITGDLDQIKRVVKLLGLVNSAPGFELQAQVINGASELLVAAFGDKGVHARAAIGVNELPMGTPVEIEMIVQVEE